MATAAGVLFGVDWLLGLLTLLAWVAVVAVSRYSSLGALAAAVFAPVCYLMGSGSGWISSPQVGVAVVVRRDGATTVTGDELLAFLDGRLARYRWPRQFVFWEALPKSGYGKITKKDVRALLFERGDVQDITPD